MSEQRVSQLAKVQAEAKAVFQKKNADYGDAFAAYGPTGVIVRLGDKIARLVSVSRKGVALVDDESLRDTLLDLHNYAAMGIMLLDERGETLQHPRVVSLRQDEAHSDICWPQSLHTQKT